MNRQTVITFKSSIRYKMNSGASCCLLDMKLGFPRPIRFLNILGGIPVCPLSFSSSDSGSCEYFPDISPTPSFALDKIFNY